MQIEIDLSHYELSQAPSHRAAIDAFGLDPQVLAKAIRFHQTLNVVATTAQFGAFIAFRNAYGGVNRVQTLKPRLIVNPLSPRIDVTGNRLAA